MKILITVILISLLIACGNGGKYRQEVDAKVATLSCFNDRKQVTKDSDEWKRVTQRCEALDIAFVKKYGYHPGD